MMYREAPDQIDAPEAPSGPPSGPVPTAFEAIVRMRCVSATYNRMAILLAPHILYTRHDELYVDGVVLERDGAVPKELKLGTFKLIGLGDLTMTSRPFFRSDLYIAADDKYAGTTLMAIEPA